MKTAIYYHVSPSKNRASILSHGLSAHFSALYEDGDEESGLTFVTDTKPDPHDSFDIWEVDTKGLTLEEDFTTDAPEGEHWYCLGSVPPENIRLLSANAPSKAPRLG